MEEAMTGFPVDPVDLLAFNDVLGDVDQIVDSLPVSEAVDFRHALGQVLVKVRETISYLDTHLINTLEGQESRDGIVYRVGRKPEHIRFDHDRILSKIAAVSSVDEETGEFLEMKEALLRLIEGFKATYLSASSRVKVGGLMRYGIDRESVESKEWGAKEVKVVDERFSPQEVPT